MTTSGLDWTALVVTPWTLGSRPGHLLPILTPTGSLPGMSDDDKRDREADGALDVRHVPPLFPHNPSVVSSLPFPEQEGFFKPRDGIVMASVSEHNKTSPGVSSLSPLNRYHDMIEVTARSLRACTPQRIKPLSGQHFGSALSDWSEA